MTLFRWAAAAAVAVSCPAAEARSFDAESPAFVVEGQGALVLERVAVRAEVQVGLAVVDVHQEFHNPFDTPVDATYLFPLPPEAAVRAMRLTCGGRTIEGELLDRDAARARFDAAAAEGRKAALLEQHRPNLFQQSVASLCPGEDVAVDLQYVDPIRVGHGRRELVVPTTVGPRYRPGDVPEPPLTTLPAHTVEVAVVLDEGLPAGSVWSDTHDIEVDEATGVTVVRSAALDTLPNRDFHLGWTLSGRDTRVAAVTAPPAGGEPGYVGLTLEPAVVEDLRSVQGRELLFVLDESCSMAGEPFAASVATVRAALAAMRPEDRFNLVRFSNTASSLFAAPSPVTPDTLAQSEAWLATFDGGGTEMTAGIVHSLTLPGDPERLRLVLLLTDGYIGEESEVVDAVRRHLGEARLFSLGVGAAVNRSLLDALADEGRGAVAYQLPGTPVAETVAQFYERIAHPALTDVAIDWGGLDVTEVYPARIPDLFAGQPVRVVARVRGSVAGARIRVTGTAEGQAIAVTRELPAPAEHEALPTLWARRKIDALRRVHADDAALLEARVTEVALAHHLVTDFTSLVATEAGVSACAPAGRTIAVPSMLPAGMSGGMGTGASGYGKGGGSFGHKGEGGIGAVGGEPIILGSIDRSTIAEVVARNLNAVRYCYQRELQKDPALGGKLTVKFTIGADGRVVTASVGASTLGNAVEACVVGRFRAMQFPAVHGGGTVTVSYPFVFSGR